MIVITPNRRLAANLSKKFHQEQMSSQKKCWHTPLILPFSSWLEKLWHEYTLKKIHPPPPRLLTPTQALMIWEEIINESPESIQLIQRSETAELAKSAWGLLKQYHLTLTHDKLDSTEDSAVFLSWARAFQAYCDKNNCLDQQALTDLIIAKVAAHDIVVIDQITLYGFTEFCPQHKKLLSHLESQGATLTYQHTEITAKTIERMHFPDTETEMRAMARSAKQYYDQYPTAKIGCVVPNLEDKREKIVRIFSETFTPQGFYTTQPLTLPFNISAGKNLSRYPVIRTALTLLSLQHAPLTTETVSALLHSPFLGEAEEEFCQRSHFTNQLYQANISTVTLKKLIEHDQKPNFCQHCPKLAARFKLLLEKIPSAQQTKTWSEWADHFVTCLTILGWPGERSTNSEEYQTIERWLNLLNQFKQIDDFLLPQTQIRALHYLHQITQLDVFQPESPETSIQILGILEAAEYHFDYLWIMGLDDTTWPPTPTPNPFVPVYLQKSLTMPHASPERELQFCKTITEQLKNSSHTVIFSSALYNDETELRPSALIETIPMRELQVEPEKYTTPAHFIFAHQAIEKIVDAIAPPITPNEKINGGSKIFELQAACPFKAFAEIRLRAKPVYSLTLGLRPLDKGMIVHHILDLFWQTTKDSATLKKQSHHITQALIKQSIATALKPYEQQAENNKHYLVLEAIRLENLILKWIEIEKSRPDFTVIAFEQAYSTEIGNIPITLRIDRIDEITGSGKLIIDYKTGKDIAIKNCFGDRPEALQLPLYCLMHAHDTIGMAYAKIHPDPEEMQLSGVSQFDLAIPNIKAITDVSYRDAATWDQQIHHWKEKLLSLSNHFCEGQAAVDPKNEVNTCKLCQLKPFCRIHETDDYAFATD